MPVLEIGGTHVTAALVDLTAGEVVDGAGDRVPLPGAGDAQLLLAEITRCATALGADPGAAWGVAVPGPFDYAHGIAWFEGVGKFDALRGVDLGEVLRAQIRPAPARVQFGNDAAAFALGEWGFGAGRGCGRMVGITLGTGVGSAFLADGDPVDSGDDVPPGGEVHRLSLHGLPLEDTVSRRAILRRFADRSAAAGRAVEQDVDVHDVAGRARAGDQLAHDVLSEAFSQLGSALAPWLARFGASTVVVGGSISRSWDLIAPALRHGLDTGGLAAVRVLPAKNPDHAALLGAALLAARPGT